MSSSLFMPFYKGIFMPYVGPGPAYPAPEGYHWEYTSRYVDHDAIPAIPAVTRRDPIVDADGNPVFTKKFSIEARRGLSFSDILEDLSPVGKPGTARFWGDWSKGHIFGPWLGRKD